MPSLWFASRWGSNTLSGMMSAPLEFHRLRRDLVPKGKLEVLLPGKECTPPCKTNRYLLYDVHASIHLFPPLSSKSYPNWFQILPPAKTFPNSNELFTLKWLILKKVSLQTLTQWFRAPFWNSHRLLIFPLPPNLLHFLKLSASVFILNIKNSPKAFYPCHLGPSLAQNSKYLWN